MSPLQIWRSPNSRFGTMPDGLDDGADETMTAVAAYTEAELGAIAAAGFNAIWVHGLLRNLVSSSIFPEFGSLADKHEDALGTLIERAARHGIKVFIFMQPPRAIPADLVFWRQHADAAGCPETPRKRKLLSLCTSTEKVRAFLRESSARLTRALPGLGGLILITASEYPSHCWARRGRVIGTFGELQGFRNTLCPRCAERGPGEVVTEIIRHVRDGAKEGNPQSQIIAWNWSWSMYEADPSAAIIGGLPRGVILMADFERGGHKHILGRERVIDEYSLSYSGPSERFTGAAACARDRGLAMMAKLQIGTTHELATVPNLPLIGNVFDKADYLRHHKLHGFMGCWNFGSMRTANTAAFNYFLQAGAPGDKRAALESFAGDYFPGCDARRVADAWEAFAKAADNYPFSIPFLYASPVNYTLAYPIEAKPANNQPCGPSWYHVDNRGDCLENSLGGYTVDEVIEGFGRIADGWHRGLDSLEAGLRGSTSPRAAEERNTARVCYHVFRSTRNTYQSWKLRCDWDDGKHSAHNAIVRDELENLREVLPILREDPRQGFHCEGFTYFFNAEWGAKKIKLLDASANE